MKRKISFIVAASAIVIVGVAGLAIWRIQKMVMSIGADRAPAAEIAEARVVTGADFLVKSEFFKVSDGGIGTAVGRGISVSDEKTRARVQNAEVAKSIYKFEDLAVIGGKVYAAAHFGGFVFGADGTLEREFAFEPIERETKIFGFTRKQWDVALDDLQIVTLSPGRIGFCSSGSSSGFTAFDENGDIMWNHGGIANDLSRLGENEKEFNERYDRENHVLEGTAGDLNGDGVPEFFVAKKNDGIHAFDIAGNELWFAPEDFPSRPLRVADIDGDGRNELVELGPKAKIRDAAGNTIRTIRVGGHDSRHLVLRGARNYECDLNEGQLTCTDDESRKILATNAPLSAIPLKPGAPKPTPIDIGFGSSIPGDTKFEDRASWPQMAFVRLLKEKPEFIAIVANYTSVNRAILYVYDIGGTLKYHEVLGENADTIAVLPAADGTDQFLVGGRTTIWRYGLK